jgi:hypothetical protein
MGMSDETRMRRIFGTYPASPFLNTKTAFPHNICTYSTKVRAIPSLVN